MAGPLRYFCYENLCWRGRVFLLWLKNLKKSLLKTEELAPLNRLKGASDAAEITEKILLSLGVNTVSTDCYSDLL